MRACSGVVVAQTCSTNASRLAMYSAILEEFPAGAAYDRHILDRTGHVSNKIHLKGLLERVVVRPTIAKVEI